MKLPLYSIRDTKAGSFQSPTVSSNDVTIARAFAETVMNKRDPIIAFSPSDFDLYCVGEFDLETGLISPVSPVRLICNAQEVINQYGQIKA